MRPAGRRIRRNGGAIMNDGIPGAGLYQCRHEIPHIVRDKKKAADAASPQRHTQLLKADRRRRIMHVADHLAPQHGQQRQQQNDLVVVGDVDNVRAK